MFTHRQLLQVIKEILPSGARLRLNIDATRRGNISRFFNHRCSSQLLSPCLCCRDGVSSIYHWWPLCGCSCDGGNLVVDVLRSRGDLLPRVAFVAAQDIDSGAELTFPYGMPSDGAADGPDAQRCLCNMASCLGWLPRGGR